MKNITAVQVVKRTIDARQRTVFVNLQLRVYLSMKSLNLKRYLHLPTKMYQIKTSSSGGGRTTWVYLLRCV